MTGKERKSKLGCVLLGNGKYRKKICSRSLMCYKQRGISQILVSQKYYFRTDVRGASRGLHAVQMYKIEPHLPFKQPITFNFFNMSPLEYYTWPNFSPQDDRCQQFVDHHARYLTAAKRDVYDNPRLDPKRFLDGPLSDNPATRLRQMLARPGIVVRINSLIRFFVHLQGSSGCSGYLRWYQCPMRPWSRFLLLIPKANSDSPASWKCFWMSFFQWCSDDCLATRTAWSCYRHFERFCSGMHTLSNTGHIAQRNLCLIGSWDGLQHWPNDTCHCRCWRWVITCPFCSFETNTKIFVDLADRPWSHAQ